MTILGEFWIDLRIIRINFLPLRLNCSALSRLAKRYPKVHYIGKRILTLVFGYLKCGSFRNPVKNIATIGATGMLYLSGSFQA